MNRTSKIVLLTLAAAVQLLSASEEVKLSTRRLDVTIKDARIIKVYDKTAKKMWAAPSGETFNMPAGLGILTDLTNFRNAHRYWGEMGMYHNPRNLPSYSLQPNYYIPCDQTKTTQKQENGWNVIVWKGLTNSIFAGCGTGPAVAGKPERRIGIETRRKKSGGKSFRDSDSAHLRCRERTHAYSSCRGQDPAQQQY